MSWLLYILLLWTLQFMYLFELWFSLGMCPGVGLLGSIVVLLLVKEGLFLIAVCRWHTSLLLTFHGQGLSNTAIPNFQGDWYLWGSRKKEKQVWWASSQGLSWDVTKVTWVLRGRAEMQTWRSLPLRETSTKTHKAKVLLVKEENYIVECKVYVVIWKKKEI